MERLMADTPQFRTLPLSVRLATAATPFIAWVLFAEFAIDRHGLDRFLPYYRVGNICVYDVIVAALIGWFWVAQHRRRA
jgi:hypothetical protein